MTLRPTGGFNSLNSSMNFTTGTEKGFKRTPANVKSDYAISASSTPVPTSSSSKKRKAAEPKKPGTRNIPARPKIQSVPEDIAEAAPKKRKTNTNKATNRIIPKSFDECDEADKMLITMRDAEGKWVDIRKKWFEMTGENTGTSSLPNRYARLKSNFTVIKEEDNARLMEAKREVEESFESQKWDLIARVVGEKKGDNYPGVVLKRQYKKLMVAGGFEPPKGVRDADFLEEGEEMEE